MRIAYGVFGYGRGHATRAAAVLPELMRRHEIRIFASGDAYDHLSPDYPLVRIPALRYAYGDDGKTSSWLTAKRNAWHILDLLLHGPQFQAVRDAVVDFHPDLVLSDAEPWLHRVARHLGLPRIGFDHYGILVYCRPPVPFADRLRSHRDVLLYRLLMGRPERIIVSSFYAAPPRWPSVRVIGPLLRPDVLQATATRGEYLLVYFNKGQHQLTPHIERALRAAGLPLVVYGTPQRGRDGSLDFRPLSNVPFVEDLAECRALVSTAGNQLVGEALHLGKPMLVMPEPSVEQRLNAAAIERLGIGMQIAQKDFHPEVLRDFLANGPMYLENIRRVARDGRREAVEVIQQFVRELTGGAATCPAATGTTTRSA
jgi:uncharacterized protein (TIGR00661 family)